MSNSSLGFCLAILLICSKGLTVHAQESQGAAAFKRIDKNNDGKLTRDEVPTAESFNTADADKNDAVTLEEFRRHIGRPRNQPDAPVGSGHESPSSDQAGLFQVLQHIPVSSGPLAVGVLDVNLDGRPDLVLPSSRGTGQFQIVINSSGAASGAAFDL